MVGGCCWQTGEIHTKKDSIARDDQGSRAIQEEDQVSIRQLEMTRKKYPQLDRDDLTAFASYAPIHEK